MSPNPMGRTKSSSFGTGIGIGVVVSVASSVILAILLSFMVINERIGESAIEYLSPVITLIASLIGCVFAGKQVEEKLAIVIGSIGVIYLLILIGTGILFFDGGFHNLWTSLLAIVFACAVSCAICIRGKSSGRKRKRAYR